MPKKKKKEKAPGGSVSPDGMGASLDGNLKSTSEMKLNMSLNKSTASLPPLKQASKLFREGDPNLALIGRDEMGEMEQALEAHGKDDNHGMQGIGGGLNVFAINKDGISRAVMKFRVAPKSMPFTICFHFPGSFLTHRYVTAIVKGLVQNIEGATVKEVQYVDRNVRLGTRGLENRWLVTVNSQKAKELLVRQGIKIVNRTIHVRSYDDILREEYQEYVRYSDLQNRMKMGFGVNKAKKLPTVSAPGDVTAVTATDTGSPEESAVALSPKPEVKPLEDLTEGSDEDEDSTED